MKIIRLSSGIGNQLFMYSFFLHIKKKYNDSFFFDDKSLRVSGANRKPELELLFPCYPRYSFLFNPSGEHGVVRRLYGLKQKVFPSFRFVNEADYNDSLYYDGDVYFDGYWQSEYYMNHNDLSPYLPKQEAPDVVGKYLNLINRLEHPVSIHIRRTDYFSPQYIDRFGVCTISFYQSAIEFVKSNFANPTFFVFSDDQEWVVSNLKLPEGTVIVPNFDINSYWYIYMMSHCHHHIISNSTFSWWGAYLNQNSSKLVVGPSIWRKDSKDTLMREDWIKILV